MRKLRKFKMLAVAVALVAALIGQQSSVDAASLTARVEVRVTGTLTNTADLQAASSPISFLRAIALSNGVGGNQANVVWSDTRTLAPSATEDLDLAGGGLTDIYGAAVAPARVRVVLIYASCSNSNNLTLLGDANSVPILNTAATTTTLQPCGTFLVTAPGAAGYVVTGGTGDIIQVANAGAGTSVTYDILILGTTS